MSTDNKCDHHLWVTTGFGFTQTVKCIVCDTNYHPDKEGRSVRVTYQDRHTQAYTKWHLLAAYLAGVVGTIILLIPFL